MKSAIITVCFVIGLIMVFGANDSGIQTQYAEFDARIQDLVWCGPRKDVIFVLTEKNTVYRSDDKGLTYKALQKFLLKAGKRIMDPEDEIGRVMRIQVSPIDEALVIMFGTHGVNWVTEDCGRSIRALNHGAQIEEYVFHPTEKTWGLAASWTECDEADEAPCEIYKKLYVTKNLGKKWSVVSEYVHQFAWGVVNQGHIDLGIPKERIYITYQEKGKGNQKSKGWNYRVDFVVSDDLFQTKKTLVPRGNRFHFSDRYLFVAQVADKSNNEVNLLTAFVSTKYSEFSNILLPIKHLKENSYAILDDSEGSVFLEINHFGEDSRLGYMYISDWLGKKFSLSLKNILRSNDRSIDFDKAQGLEGVYFANVYNEDEAQKWKTEVETKSNQKKSKHEKNKAQKETEGIVSRISFNKGGSWLPIKAPKVDSKNKAIKCDNFECSLHLHGFSHPEYPPFYTLENAVGLILGVGNVGTSLDFREDKVNTYFSRDGGLTWMEIKKGSHIYEMGDHGAIIVLAPDQKATDEVFYSWNEGLTWQTLSIPNGNMEVTNIMIEPEATSQIFLLYGTKVNDKQQEVGVIVSLDFTGLHEPRCKGAENPGTPESDYEIWTPYDGRHGDTCLMGRKIEYLRRKRESECFNGEPFERGIYTQHCLCTEEDYECDYGFSRINDGPCQSPKPINYSAPAECTPGTRYSVSQGYRKIAGDSCMGGVSHDPIILKCPSGAHGWVTAGLLLIVVFVVLAFLFVSGNREEYITKINSFFLGGRKDKPHREGTPNYNRGLGGNPDTPLDDIDDLDSQSLKRDEDDINLLRDENDTATYHRKERHLSDRNAISTASKSIPQLKKPSPQKKGAQRISKEDDSSLDLELE